MSAPSATSAAPAINNARFGRYCSVASGVTIGAHEHPTDWLTTSRTAYYPEIHGWDALVAGPAAAERPRPQAPLPRPAARSPRSGPTSGSVRAPSSRPASPSAPARSSAPAPRCCTTCRPTPSSSAPRRGWCACASRRRRSSGCSALEWWRYSIYDLFDAPMDSIDAALDVIEDSGRPRRGRPYAGPVVGPAELADAAGPRCVARRPPLMARAS